ncbi:unnamed protein product [Caenorhabditis brenneri]
MHSGLSHVKQRSELWLSDLGLGGPSLPIECDPKRPWPQCPPQSYCYATGTVDIGPYFCCPVWSTYGAARSVRVLMGRVH